MKRKECDSKKFPWFPWPRGRCLNKTNILYCQRLISFIQLHINSANLPIFSCQLLWVGREKIRNHSVIKSANRCVMCIVTNLSMCHFWNDWQPISVNHAHANCDKFFPQLGDKYINCQWHLCFLMQASSANCMKRK